MALVALLQSLYLLRAKRDIMCCNAQDTGMLYILSLNGIAVANLSAERMLAYMKRGVHRGVRCSLSMS